jgi:exodeoxyribonuclease VII large subunit
LLKSYAFNRPIDLLRQHSQRLDEQRRILTKIVAHTFSISRHNFHSLQQRVASLNPETILKRGYAMVSKDGRIIGSAGLLEERDAVSVRFHDGNVPAVVTKTKS